MKQLLLCIFMLSTLQACQNTAKTKTPPPLKAVDVQKSYEAQSKQTTSLTQTPPKVLPEHLGLSIRMGSLNDLLKQTIYVGIREHINGEESAKVGPISIPLKFNNQLIDLDLAPDPSCPTCFKIKGKVLGTYKFGKVVGDDKSHQSRFSMIAPLIFTPAKNGGATLALDLAQMTKFGGFIVESKLNKLPAKYKKKASSLLEKILIGQASKYLKPIPIITINGPSFGVDGLNVLPAGMSIDVQTKTLNLALYTNISNLPNKLDILKTLDKKQALAMGINAQLFTHALRLSMKQSKIPNQYAANGQPNGAFHVFAKDTIVDTNAKGALEQIRLMVGVYRFDNTKNAVMANAEVVFKPIKKDKSITFQCVGIQWKDVQGKGPLPDKALWKQTVFNQKIQSWINTSLATPKLALPFTSGTLGIQHISAKDQNIASAFGLSFAH